MSGIAWPRGWLEAQGFRAEAGHSWRRDALRLMARDGWLILEKDCVGVETDPLQSLTGCPGLWKRTGAEGSLQVFELPLHVLRAAGSEGWEATDEDLGRTAVDAVDSVEETDSAGTDSAFADGLRAAVSWALTTCKEEASESSSMAAISPSDQDPSAPGQADWHPPSVEKLDALLPPDSLTVQSGGVVLQGSVHRDAGRLALSIPLCSSIPGPISSAHRHWLRELLLDGQNTWRMVRLCWDERTESSSPPVQGVACTVPWAEVDMTGAPALLLDALVPAALAAIRWVVVWMAHSADFLADGTCHCRLLEACFTRD
jgi:hypothetical protein